eukprot:gene11497-biopygen15422
MPAPRPRHLRPPPGLAGGSEMAKTRAFDVVFDRTDEGTHPRVPNLDRAPRSTDLTPSTHPLPHEECATWNDYTWTDRATQ